MRSILLATALLSYQTTPNIAQSYFATQDDGNYFEWFHEHAQVDLLYSDHSTLYIFTDKVNVRQKPTTEAAIVAQLTVGQEVTNIAYTENSIPKGLIGGYSDMWYHVKGKDAKGTVFEGYIWGTHLAKGWREADLTGDGKTEFVMLGISTQPRKNAKDIKAEIRILQQNKVVGQATVPGLCIFEACDSSPMLRVLKSQLTPGMIIIEASTMTIGCMTGIDKAFFYWNGSGLERVYQAEYSTQTELFKKQFVIAPAGSQQTTVQRCEYGGEDSDYNPIWNCKTVYVNPVSEAKPIAAAAQNKKGFLHK